MPFPKDFLPHPPIEGPPVPRVLPGWPAVPKDVDEAVYHYAKSAERAIYHYQQSLSRAVERYSAYWSRSIVTYREALERLLPPQG